MKYITITMLMILGCLVLMFVILVGVAVQPDKYYPHQCQDSTHRSCDGVCPCDGLGCSEYDIFFNSK